MDQCSDEEEEYSDDQCCNDYEDIIFHGLRGSWFLVLSYKL